MPSFLQKVRSLAPARADLKPDLVAGLTFAVVAVPQAMGHALLATVNPVMGIFTLMVAVPVAAVTTGSVFMNVSTTAATAVAAGAELADIAPGDRLAALAALVLLVGVIQLLAGVLRAGSILRFVSDPVMTGFLNGVAVLIILGQLGELTGYRSTFSNAVARALDLLLRLHRIDVRTTVIGGLALGAIVLLLRSRLSKFAFVLAIGARHRPAGRALAPGPRSRAGLAGGPDRARRVEHPAQPPRPLPAPARDAPHHAACRPCRWPSSGSSRAPGSARPTPTRTDGSRTSPGTSSAREPPTSPPVSSAASRRAAPSPAPPSSSAPAPGRAGPTSSAASPWPSSCSWPHRWPRWFPCPPWRRSSSWPDSRGCASTPALTAWRTGWAPAAAMTLTFLATLFLPLHFAVLLGVAFTMLLHVTRESNRTEVSEIVLVPGGMPELRPAPREAPSNQLTVLVVNGSLFFAAAKSVGDMLPSVEGSSRAVVVLALRGKTDLGSTFIAVLQRYALALQARGGRLMLAGVDPAAREQLARTGLLQIIGEENVFLATEQLGASVNQAAAAARAWLGQAPSGETR